jgi:hypothetical protein
MEAQILLGAQQLIERRPLKHQPDRAARLATLTSDIEAVGGGGGPARRPQQHAELVDGRRLDDPVVARQAEDLTFGRLEARADRHQLPEAAEEQVDLDHSGRPPAPRAGLRLATAPDVRGRAAPASGTAVGPAADEEDPSPGDRAASSGRLPADRPTSASHAPIRAAVRLAAKPAGRPAAALASTFVGSITGAVMVLAINGTAAARRTTP